VEIFVERKNSMRKVVVLAYVCMNFFILLAVTQQFKL